MLCISLFLIKRNFRINNNIKNSLEIGKGTKLNSVMLKMGIPDLVYKIPRYDSITIYYYEAPIFSAAGISFDIEDKSQVVVGIEEYE